jgi:DeoR/GlpR family transcriptional regulator of sugar metabolism
VASGERVIALADRDSFGASAFVKFASLEETDTIAVAGAPSEAALQPFVERGITIAVGGTS